MQQALEIMFIADFLNLSSTEGKDAAFHSGIMILHRNKSYINTLRVSMLCVMWRNYGMVYGRDMFIEYPFMRYGHGRAINVRITLKPETLKTWALSSHVRGQLVEELASVKGETADN